MVNILVVDDELSLRKLIKTNLVASGYSVTTAKSGEDGLELAQLMKPDLILTDIKMPGISGWDMLTKLSTIFDLKQTMVIVMTAFPRESEENRAQKIAVDFMVKPFSVSELLSKVEKALREQKRRKVNN
jgi:DNA-binding response OmpR family regulator